MVTIPLLAEKKKNAGIENCTAFISQAEAKMSMKQTIMVAMLKLVIKY
jgi:hypothetical protein